MEIVDLFPEGVVSYLCEIVVFVLVLFGSFVLGLGVARAAEVVVDASETFPARTSDVGCFAK